MTEQTETNRLESIISLLAQILRKVQHIAVDPDGKDIDIGGEIMRLRRLYEDLRKSEEELAALKQHNSDWHCCSCGKYTR